jgi:hypothetical protein
MAQCVENCEHKAKSNDRIALLADRLAVCLVLLKQRHGSDWNPWFGEGMWQDGETLSGELRDWPEYAEAKEIVKLFIKRSERDAKG